MNRLKEKLADPESRVSSIRVYVTARSALTDKSSYSVYLLNVDKLSHVVKALNEAVIESSSTSLVQLFTDGSNVTSYRANGLYCKTFISMYVHFKRYFFVGAV